MCAPLAPLHALLSRFAVWKSILATHCVSAAHAIFLVCLEAALAALERLFTAIFDCESRLLSVPPCGVFPSEQSAIVILGDADGMDHACVHTAMNILMPTADRGGPRRCYELLRARVHRLPIVAKQRDTGDA